MRRYGFFRHGATLGLVVCLAAGAAAQDKAADAEIKTEVQKSLDSKRFSNVQSSVKNGVVTLTGTVDVYATKEDAEHRIHHKKAVVAVQNSIEVRGADNEGAVSDVELRNKLAEKLAYDRVGYGTTAFNSFTLGVQNGVVTLGGVAYGPTDKDSAISLVSHYPGVRDVVDEIEVAPTSPNDDRIRIEAARAIYGFPSLQRYALDPAKPIRIKGVPGAFKVVNDLQVAAPRQEGR